MPSHVRDLHFRAFLLITQAPFVVKIISDDVLVQNQTCVTQQVSVFMCQVSGDRRRAAYAQNQKSALAHSYVQRTLMGETP